MIDFYSYEQGDEDSKNGDYGIVARNGWNSLQRPCNGDETSIENCKIVDYITMAYIDSTQDAIGVVCTPYRGNFLICHINSP